MGKKKLTGVELSKARARAERDVQEVRNRLELNAQGLNPSRSQATQMGEDEITRKLKGKDGNRPGGFLRRRLSS